MPQILGYQPPTMTNHAVQMVAGSWSIAASGGAATKIEGLGWEVAKSATGQYTITLQDNYVGLISAQFTVGAATAVDLKPQLVSSDVVSAKTVIMKLLAVATATEPSAVTLVHFVLFLRNSTVGQ